MVGLLFEKTERVTDFAFVLDDGTGRIDCHRWYVIHAFLSCSFRLCSMDYVVVLLMLDESAIS